jgi:hypothetical protein
VLRGRGIGLGEFFEQLCLLLRGHPNAGVGDGELDEAAAIAHLRAASLTSPALVNLQALLSRLSRICRSRMGSTDNAPRFQLPLERPSISRPYGEWNDGDYDVLADGVVVGGIMKAARRAPCSKYSTPPDNLGRSQEVS